MTKQQIIVGPRIVPPNGSHRFEVALEENIKGVTLLPSARDRYLGKQPSLALMSYTVTLDPKRYTAMIIGADEDLVGPEVGDFASRSILAVEVANLTAEPIEETLTIEYVRYQSLDPENPGPSQRVIQLQGAQILRKGVETGRCALVILRDSSRQQPGIRQAELQLNDDGGNTVGSGATDREAMTALAESLVALADHVLDAREGDHAPNSESSSN